MKKILFDLDGTLTDSGEGILHCAELTLAHFGLPIPPRSEMRAMVGPPLRDSFRKYGIAEEELDNAVAFYRKHYLAVGQFENFPYSGIAELLSKLKDEGNALYVATSKPEAMAKDILRYFRLDGYFTLICGAASDGLRNTKEAVIAYLLEQLHDREDLVMVGDTIYDVLGAAFHGIPCIGVTWGYGVAADMEKAGAKLAGSMQELYEYLQ